MNQNEIFAGVKQCLANSLAIDAQTIQLNSVLTTGLGVDSLDLVDIIFSLEKQFQVKLRNPQIDGLLRGEFASTAHLFIPLSEIEQLEPWLPALAAVEDKTKILPAQLFNFVTVEFLVKLIDYARQNNVRA